MTDMTDEAVKALLDEMTFAMFGDGTDDTISEKLARALLDARAELARVRADATGGCVMDKEFKHPLGSIVVIDPTGVGRGLKARVCGHIRFDDGSIGYMTSTVNFQSEGVMRNILAENDICAPTD